MSLPLQFEDTHAVVVTSCKVVQRGMGSQDPVSVGVSSCLVNLYSSVQVPESESLVLRVGQENLKPRMEYNTRDIVCVAFHRVHLPMLVARESPELDALVIGSRCHDAHGWMKSNPVNTALVTFEDVLDLDLGPTKNFVWPGPALLHALFLELREIPDPDCLIKRCTGNQCIVWMEGRAHDVMAMPSKYGDDIPALPVPQSHSLVITA